MKTQTTEKIQASLDQPNGKTYDITISCELWGPDEASAFLAKMPDHQRSAKQWSISRITQSVQNGEFWFNGDTFVFNEHDEAVDGQHRCHAIIKTGKVIPVIVVRGVPRESYITIDGDGVGKSTADFFRFQSIPNANSAAAAAMLLHRYEKRSKEGQLKHTSLVTRPQIFECYEEHSAQIQKYCTQFAPVATFVGSKAITTVVCVLVENAYGSDFLEMFLTEFSTGMGSCKAIKTLRTAFDADNKRSRKSMTPDTRFVSLLEAARILYSQSSKVLIKPAIQKAPTLL